MTSPAVDQLLYLLDEAFNQSDEHSLTANVAGLKPEEWTARPPGAQRAILAIFGHAAATKYLYENHVFGDGTMGWTDHILTPIPPGASFSPGLMIEWAEEAHQRFRQAVARLSESDLSEVRYASIWDQSAETRWFIAQVIEHDLYHAGEINHVRALLQGDDNWRGQVNA
ncbi:MAG TPA: DinB family protein [Dehalococcoidia bacterium]|nr:DinB family protein [Dehalococcoidia bacterium]